MNIEEIKAREKAATPGPWENGPYVGDEPEIIYGVGRQKVARIFDEQRDRDFIAGAREDIPALIAELERKSKEALSFHAIATEHYEETVRLKAQLEAEILRRDSLDETITNVVADHKRDAKKLAAIREPAKIVVERFKKESLRVGDVLILEAALAEAIK